MSRSCAEKLCGGSGGGMAVASRRSQTGRFATASPRPVGRGPTGAKFGTAYRAHWRHGWRVCLAASSGQAPTPHSGAPKARGLTAKARTERSSMLPRCTSSSDTVREIKYQILQLTFCAMRPTTDEEPGHGDRRVVEREATTQLTTLTSVLAG